MDECKICGGKAYRIVYQGDIRGGAYGKLCEDAEISECETCGVQRLAERFCLPASHYETEAYRKKLEQALASSPNQSKNPPPSFPPDIAYNYFRE